VYLFSLATGRTQRLSYAAREYSSEQEPTLSDGRVAWVRYRLGEQHAGPRARIYITDLQDRGRSRQINPDAELPCRHTCPALHGRVTDLELAGRRIAAVVNINDAGKRTSLRLATIGSGLREVERRPAGTRLLGPSFLGGGLYVFRSCRMSGGCAQPGTWRYAVSDLATRHTDDATPVFGAAFTRQATFLLRPAAAGETGCLIGDPCQIQATPGALHNLQ
jgi:hypothetical protein